MAAARAGAAAGVSAICLTAGGAAVRLATAAFTLAWMHSVERIPWQEDWRVRQHELVLVGSRVEGSGAGMEVPQGFRRLGLSPPPEVPPQRRLFLADSETGRRSAPAPRRACIDLGGTGGAPIVLEACR